MGSPSSPPGRGESPRRATASCSRRSLSPEITGKALEGIGLRADRSRPDAGDQEAKGGSAGRGAEYAVRRRAPHSQEELRRELFAGDTRDEAAQADQTDEIRKDLERIHQVPPRP